MELIVSVIICTYNREKYLPNAFKSLAGQTADKNLYEVIVVNNNSADNTEQVCKDFAVSDPPFAFYYFNEKEQGASFARNTGAVYAKGRLLCFMDDDAVAEPEFIANIIKFTQQFPDVEGFGGRIIPLYIPQEPKWMSHFVSSLVGNFKYADAVTEFSANRYPLESNMIVTRKIFDAVNGFNAALPGVKGTLRIGGEGKDFFMRAKEKGCRVFYVPDIVVHHVVETDKLTREYMYRVASGIGRGEKERMRQKGGLAVFNKAVEYFFKLGAAIVISLKYLVQFRVEKIKPLINFRVDVLKGFFDIKL